MTDREALLRHIIDHPDDDDARLVMADWFDEHGEPERAEFIRLQVSLAGPARARSLESAHAHEWLDEVPRWARNRVRFHRGFISSIECEADDWCRNAAELHAAAPITDVSLRVLTSQLERVTGCPTLARVSALTLDVSGSTNVQESRIFASPHLAGLRSFTLFRQLSAGITTYSLAYYWRHPGLTRLHIDDQYSFGPGGVQMLADNPAFASLTELLLPRTFATGPPVARLAGSPHLGNLTSLALATDDAGVLELARSASLARLTRLCLRHSRLTPAGVVQFATEPGLARIRFLDLTEIHLGDAGARALANSPFLAGLRTLTVSNRLLDQEATAALTDRFGTACRFEKT